MIKSHKNTLFHYLLSKNLLDKFEINEINGELILFAKTPEKFFFKIIGLEHTFDSFDVEYTMFAPGFPERLVTAESKMGICLVHFESWYENHVQRYLNEFNTPDLWEEYRNSLPINQITNEEYQNNTSFSLEEKALIMLTLSEIKIKLIENFVSTDENRMIVEQRFEYLAASLDRIENKTDWKGILISSIFTLIVALSLDTTRGQQLLELFMSFFRTIQYLN